MVRATSAARFALLALALGVFACSSPDSQLQDQQKALRGLHASTTAVGDAWVHGDASPTYVRTALQQTLQLLDKQRASLNASPQLLLDPRGIALSRDAEQLSRTLAALIQDARARDTAAARQHLAEVPAITGSGQ